MTDTNTAEREALMNLADAYAEASFDQGLHQRTLDDAPEEARVKLEKALRNALAGRASLAASAGSEPVIGWHAFPHYLQHPDGRLLRTASDLLARHGYTGCAEPLRAMSDVLLSTNPYPREGMAWWISVDERLPESGTPVLLDIGKKYPIRAMWAPAKTLEASNDSDAVGDYDEATDTYYCPEGWYEWNQHEETHWFVTETPRAWMPLPASEAKEL